MRKGLLPAIGAGLIVGVIWVAVPRSVSFRRFVISPGESAQAVARRLYDAGWLWHPRTFLFWVRWGGTRSTLRPGVYELPFPASARGLFKVFQKGPPRVRVTFPEGWTARQMANLLEEKGITSAREFLDIVEKEKREGTLFPDTYLFDQASPAPKVVAALVRRFGEMVPRDFAERARDLKLSERQLITLASLVEREAKAPEERALIAGVFYNRLRKHWRLESCATVQYALGQWKKQLTYRDLEVDSPYNTYRHPGLPPGPIGNPGAAALMAAAHPAPTDMMFFVADGQGTHRFSRYYRDHIQQKRKTLSH